MLIIIMTEISSIKSRTESFSIFMIKPFYKLHFFYFFSVKKGAGRKALFGRNS